VKTHMSSRSRNIKLVLGHVRHKVNEKPTSVLILAGDTDGNIGDRAIVYSTCQELRRTDPEIRITLVSGRPDADRDFFDASTVPRGLAGIPALLRAAMGSDLVLCGGGGLFQDDTSLVKMPYWAARLALVRCVCANIHGYSLGVGPLRWASSRLAARFAFGCMRGVSARDDYAVELAQRLTAKVVRRVPDPALGLPPASDEQARAVLAEAGVPDQGVPIVGVAVRRWFHHRSTIVPHKYAVRLGLRKAAGRESCDKFTTLMAGVLDRLAERHGAHVLFMPTYNVSHEADDLVSMEVLRKMRSGRGGVSRISDPRLYKAVCGRLAVMLGGRMHPTIFAAAMGTPVIGLSYNSKFEGFFRSLGRETDVIPIEEFVHREMTREMTDLLSACIEGRIKASPVEPLIEQTRRFTSQLMCSAAARAEGRGESVPGRE